MKSKPKVSVIITHHLNINDEYLDACLLGIVSSEGVAFEVLVVSDAVTRPDVNKFLSYKNITVHWDPSLDTATKKIAFAIDQLVSIDSTHLFFLSDDVVVSRRCIADLYYSFRSRHMILCPMSNSDLGSRYESDLEIYGNKRDKKTKLVLKPDMTLQQFTQDQLAAVIRFRTGQRVLIRTDWVCFYAVMMTKGIWRAVQGYDPKLEYRHNDQDFCLNAQKLGIPSVINIGAFAFHFGSRTMRFVSDAEKNMCTNHFINKWKM